MGCEKSKPTKQHEHNGVTNNNGDVFTENQIDTLRSTWPLLSRDMKTNGIQVFRFIFLSEPKIKSVFKHFRNMSDEEILKNQGFLRHVEHFMKLIGDVVEQLDTNKEDQEKLLLILGAKHAMYDGFKEDYFSVYTKCVMEVWESVIAEEFISEVKDSWEALFVYVVRYMSEGYLMYLHEQSTTSHTNDLADIAENRTEEEEDIT